MRKTIWVTLATAALLLGAQQAHGQSRDCRVRGTTVTADSRFRLFVSSNDRTSSKVYRACRIAGRKTRLLGRNDDDNGVIADTLQIAGIDAVWAEQVCDLRAGSCIGAIYGRNLRSGSRTRTISKDGAAEIAAASATTLAWVRYVDADAVEVVVRDRNGERVVDSGTGDERGSLARRGARGYWTRDAVPHSFALE